MAANGDTTTTTVQAQPGEFDKGFAITTGVILVVLWVASVWPLFWEVEKLLDGTTASTGDVIGTMLAIFGSVVLALGAFSAALENRSRMHEERSVSVAGRYGVTSVGDAVKPILEGTADLLDKFGKLPPSALLLATSLGLFGGAAALVWS